MLVSTSGSEQGFAGARAWAQSEAGGPVDGVIVLGDMAGTKLKKPWVVSWTGTAASPPLGLERTVQAAVRREIRSDAGGPRALGQWVRRALPIAVSEQGAIGREGLPAVLLSETGELGPAPRRRGQREAPRRLRPRGAGRDRRDRRRRAARRRGVRGRAERDRDAAQRPDRLERAARRRLAAAARDPRRARRVLPRPPPARARSGPGWPGWRSPPSRCRSPGRGCARSVPPA